MSARARFCPARGTKQLSRAEIGDVIGFRKTMTDGYRDLKVRGTRATAMNGGTSRQPKVPTVVSR
jgi:hypothetical protein